MPRLKTDFCIVMMIIIFPWNCWRRDWLLNPMFNHLSWAYYSLFFSLFFHAIGTNYLYKVIPSESSVFINSLVVIHLLFIMDFLFFSIRNRVTAGIKERKIEALSCKCILVTTEMDFTETSLIFFVFNLNLNTGTLIFKIFRLGIFSIM